MSVHYQFLDESFKINTLCLGCVQITAVPLNSITVAAAIKKVLGEYNINPRDVVFTTDSDGKLKKACAENGWERFACLAHDLHLLVQCDGFATSRQELGELGEAEEDEVLGAQPVPELINVIKGCRAVVEYFKRGNGQRLLEERGGTALKIDVKTRWNSVYIMIESVLKNYEKVAEILIANGNERLYRNLHKEKLEILQRFLKPFYQATTIFSSQSQETLASVWPTVVALREFLNTVEYTRIDGIELEDENDDGHAFFPDLERVRKNMIDGLNSLAGRRHIRMIITNPHKFAAFLDPRLRHLSFATSSERTAVHKAMQDMIAEVMTSIDTMETYFQSEIPANALSIQQSSCFGASRFYQFNDSSASAGTATNIPKRTQEELSAYLAYPLLPGFSETVINSVDFPLVFWKERGKQFPHLMLLARKYLSLPATSVPSEQIFATAGRVITERRSLLSGKRVEMLVFCKKNIAFWNSE